MKLNTVSMNLAFLLTAMVGMQQGSITSPEDAPILDQASGEDGSWIHDEELVEYLIQDSTERSVEGQHGCVHISVFQLPGPAQRRKVMVVASAFAVGQPGESVQSTSILDAHSAAPLELIGEYFEITINPRDGSPWGEVVSSRQIEVAGHEAFYG